MPWANLTPSPSVNGFAGLSPEDLASFRALGAEVCLRSEPFGDVWIVPSYTGQSRMEITPEHAATILQIAAVFPGSQVVSFHKPSKPVPLPAEENRS